MITALYSHDLQPALPTAIDVEYRLLDAWPNYCVGSDGTVWSCKAKGGNNPKPGRLRASWRKLSQCPNSDGYACVNFTRDGVNKIVQVSHIVLETFSGPRPDGMEACHFPDPDRMNSRVDNLRWDTPSANQQDRKAHGTVTRMPGQSNPFAKLTDDLVREIVRRRKLGEALHVIAAAVGTTKANVCRICQGKNWTHITGGALEKRYAKRRT